MDNIDFPLYRKSLNDKNLYKIESSEKITELQLLGQRWLRYDLSVSIYPDKLLLNDLMAMSGYAELEPSVFEDCLKKVS